MPSSLTRTVRPRGVSVQYPRRNGVRVDQALARELGISEARSHRILYQWPRLLDVVPAAIRAYRDAGDLLGLARLSAVADAARAAVASERPRLTAALLVGAQDADATEEVAETAYHTNPGRATAEAFVRALDRQQFAAATLRAALVERWAL
jgi:hypothetical protein